MSRGLEQFKFTRYSLISFDIKIAFVVFMYGCIIVYGQITVVCQ